MIRIVVMSVPMLSSLIRNLQYTPPPDVSIRLVEAFLDDAVNQARRIEEAGEVDVFVSAGSNARLLSEVVTKPLVEVSVTGFDLLHAFTAAKKFSDTVAVFTYPDQIEHLSGTLDVLSLSVRTVEYDFEDLTHMDQALDALQDQGIHTIIGSSLMVQMAKRRGMTPVFIYSGDSMKRALDQAIQLAKSNQQEADRSKRFETILDFTYGGIIGTDAEGCITAFNPPAERITGIEREKALGRFIGGIFPGLRLSRVVHLQQPELNQIVSAGNKQILANYIPIISEGVFTGAVVTFQDFGAIQAAEEKIRSKIYSKGFLVRTSLENIYGRSPALERAKESARLYASSGATILILGESGTGKELFARGIHRASERSDQPFVAINCGAFPEQLLESELFGYDEGAFTGARRGGKKGLIEMAHHGTLFLDEIAEMPTALQTRMLRVLEEREVMHVGGDRIINVDIRVIAATNKDLAALVRAGQFREDLYYRLNVLNLRIPPLRERPEDIPLLAALFLAELLPGLQAAAIRRLAAHPCLLRYSWPGNIREFKNFMERFAVLSPAFPDGEALLASLFDTAGEDECAASEVIVRALREAGGNRAEAARKLGISRTTLWRKIKGLGHLAPPAADTRNG
ncbi:MAG: sigma 54-interacting transcriptional regulator [Desulfovibrionaceae bacterium]|nr:sigma 54-interacting transcriptional regulator [Desulfovibrionaceae bacterium]